VNLGIDPRVQIMQVGSEQIRFYERGVGQALILIHGMFGDHLDWEPVLEPLSRSHRVVAIDLPGFGESSKPRCEYSEDLFTDALEQLLDQLRIKEAVLIGNSFGGEVAIFYALRHPKVVSKLVLVDSGGFRKATDEEKVFTEVRFSESALASLTPEGNALLFSPVFHSVSKVSARYLERQNAKLQRADYPAYAHALASSIRLVMAICLLERLPAIQCRTLLVWGERDQVLPVDQARVALNLLRNGGLELIPGCGHVPQLECPEAFLRTIERFLG
jgi:2-hydroxy-6-oxonona-2,4-dienedioate hydrolase